MVSDVIVVQTQNRTYAIDAPAKMLRQVAGPDRGSKTIPADGTPVKFSGVDIQNDRLLIGFPDGKCVFTSPIKSVEGAEWISGTLA